MCLKPEEIQDDSKKTMQNSLEILNSIILNFVKLVISSYVQQEK
jgi:hypothetical protein